MKFDIKVLQKNLGHRQSSRMSSIIDKKKCPQIDLEQKGEHALMVLFWKGSRKLLSSFTWG